MSEWTKHFDEQVINKGEYTVGDTFILAELFEGLVSEVTETDEGGQRLNDEEMIDSYFNIIRQYLVPSHYQAFQRIVADMTAEAEAQEKAYHQRRGYDYELLQEEPHSQAEEG